MQTTTRPVAGIFRLAWWGLIIAITLYFMNGANHFLRLTPEALGKYFTLRWILIAHITAGGAALVLGPPQFWKTLQSRYKRLHRAIGITYLLAVAISGTCAVVLAFTTAYSINWAYAFSLQVWVGVWISSSAIAYWAAIKKKFLLHKEWMTRSYIVTIAFVLSGLAIKLPFVKSLGDFAEITPSLFWLAWAVPLYVYQLLLAVKSKASAQAK